jgi:hypothetical protein
MVIGRASGAPSTVVSAKAGMNFDSGSFRLSLPSSTNIIAATDVTGLVIE